jgi:RNA polymerase sigma-70 factor (ECF subfamily)
MDPDADRDEAVMAEVARGRRDALAVLVRRHADALLGFLVRMLVDRHRAEELFQETFLAVWLKRHQYEPGRPFRPWLYAIALNKCREHWRLRSPAPVPLGGAAADARAGGAAPDDGLLAAERAALVEEALAGLPPRQRAVVSLRIWDGLPYARIAEVVDCTEATVRSHMHHGLAALRKKLAPRLGAPDERESLPRRATV